MHALELQLCTNVLSSCFVHEMHEMSNHNNYHHNKDNSRKKVIEFHEALSSGPRIGAYINNTLILNT